MKTYLKFAILLLMPGLTAAAQVQPAATGGHVPIPPGSLNYSIDYSQSIENGGGLGTWQMSTLSGSLAYSNKNERLPFSMTYGGGYDWAISGPDYGTGLFQHLLISQAVAGRKWSISASDNVSYTPEAPTFGFTGIPGLGEPITGQIPPPSLPDQSILTVNTKVLDNAVTGQATHKLSPGVALSLDGSYEILRFPEDNGINSNTVTGTGGLSWRIDARNSIFGNYIFSQFEYPDFGFSFQTHSGLFGFQRAWSRKITTSVSAGPEWTASSNTVAVPSSLGVDANANLTYQFGYSNAGLGYTRGINSGAGYLIGGETDAVTASYSRQFGRELSTGFSGSYMRTAALGSYGATAAKYGEAEVTRRLGKYWTVFANYSAIVQSSSASLPENTLGQLLQVVGFGFGFSPRQINLRR